MTSEYNVVAASEGRGPWSRRVTYRLSRILPNGSEREHTGLKSKRQAAQAAFYVLWDNAVCSKREATECASDLENLPIGTTHIAHGYTFRIEVE